MKKLSIYLFLFILSFSIPSHANDIKEFEIEGISIGDSLLDYLSKEEIIKGIEFNKPAYKNYSNDFGEVYIFDNFESYDRLSFKVKPDDKKYIIYHIKGSISYDNKLDQCFAKKEEIKQEFSKIFKNAKQQSKTLKFKFDSTGKSVTYSDYFYLDSGDFARVGCAKYRKDLKIKNNWEDSLQVTIGTEEIIKWFSKPIN